MRAFAPSPITVCLHLSGATSQFESLRSLLDIVQPLSEKESNNLRGYMRSLLPHPKATHMSIERFYAFASAIESIAQRRSSEVGDKARASYSPAHPKHDKDERNSKCLINTKMISWTIYTQRKNGDANLARQAHFAAGALGRA